MTAFTIDAPTATLAAALEDAGAALEHPTDLHKTAAALVARLAAPPRRTGRLISSQAVDVEADAGIVRWGVGYAVYVNFGTRNMRAQPFATGALERATDSVTAAARDYLTDVTTGVRV